MSSRSGIMSTMLAAILSRRGLVSSPRTKQDAAVSPTQIQLPLMHSGIRAAGHHPMPLHDSPACSPDAGFNGCMQNHPTGDEWPLHRSPSVWCSQRQHRRSDDRKTAGEDAPLAMSTLLVSASAGLPTIFTCDLENEHAATLRASRGLLCCLNPWHLALGPIQSGR